MPPVKFNLCRFLRPFADHSSIGLLSGRKQQLIKDLGDQNISFMESLAQMNPRVLMQILKRASRNKVERLSIDSVGILSPIGEAQPVYVEGSMRVLNSKDDVVGPGEMIRIHDDTVPNIPTPGFVSMFSSEGRIVGYTSGTYIGPCQNQVAIPLSKSYAAGPTLVTGSKESEVKKWKVSLIVYRDKKIIFQGESRIGDGGFFSFNKQRDSLFNSDNEFPNGAALFSEIDIVPEEGFNLEPGDVVEVKIPKIGTLRNTVAKIRLRTGLDSAG